MSLMGSVLLIIKGAVCKLDSMFATSQHQDAQELLEYLMNGLNEDLNKVSYLFIYVCLYIL